MYVVLFFFKCHQVPFALIITSFSPPPPVTYSQALRYLSQSTGLDPPRTPGRHFPFFAPTVSTLVKTPSPLN